MNEMGALLRQSENTPLFMLVERSHGWRRLRARAGSDTTRQGSGGLVVEDALVFAETGTFRFGLVFHGERNIGDRLSPSFDLHGDGKRCMIHVVTSEG